MLARATLLTSLVFVSLAPALVGCSDLGTHDLRIDGSDAVRVGPTATDDGWSLSFSSVVVVLRHPGLVERLDDEPAWVRELGVTVWELVGAEADGELIASRMIRAKAYDGVDFHVANPGGSAYEAMAGNVDDAVVEAMVDADRGLRVVGSASDGMTTVGFDWMFDLTVRYRCPLGDAGFTLAADGEESSTIEIAAEALFRDDAGSLGFAAIAAADGDGDGTVTRGELESAGLLDEIDARAKTLAGVRGGETCESFEPDVEG